MKSVNKERRSDLLDEPPKTAHATFSGIQDGNEQQEGCDEENFKCDDVCKCELVLSVVLHVPGKTRIRVQVKTTKPEGPTFHLF